MHLNGMHSQLGSAFEIERAIVDKAAFLCGNLCRFKCQSVDIAFRLAQSDEAGTKEKPEYLAQTERLHPVVVEFAGFIIDRGHQVLARFCEPSCELEHARKRLGKRKHVVSECFTRKSSRSIENCPVEIFIQRDFATLKRRDDHLVTIMKFSLVQLESLDRIRALRVIPCVGQQHAAHIPEESANRRHEVLLKGV